MDKFVTTAKEIAPHLITRIGANSALDALRRARDLDPARRTSASRAEQFDKIYSTATWGAMGARGAGCSGHGLFA